MPRGPDPWYNRSHPRPHSPYRELVLKMVLDGKPSKTFGRWPSRDAAIEARRGFYRAINGSGGIFLKTRFPFLIAAKDIAFRVGGGYGVGVSLYRPTAEQARKHRISHGFAEDGSGRRVPYVRKGQR